MDDTVHPLFDRPYKYRPLDRDKGDIRLLHILPSQKKILPLQCRLQHQPLDDPATVYEALSYTWGTGERTHIIHVDGHNLKVTQNLFHALKFLRQPHETRAIWIDAICINQEGTNEWAQEVLRMLGIYRNATGVVAWLGPADTNSRIAVQALRELENEWKFYSSSSVYNWAVRILCGSFQRVITMAFAIAASACHVHYTTAWLVLSFCQWLPSYPLSVYRYITGTITLLAKIRLFTTSIYNYWILLGFFMDNLDRPSEETIRALASLFDRSWFRRAWIVQEVAAAQKLTLVCGHDQLDWSTVLNAIGAMEDRIIESTILSPYIEAGYRSHRNLFRFVSQAARGFSILLDLDDLEIGATQAELCLHLLGEFRRTLATDDRDKIYAFIGLCTAQQEGYAAGQSLEESLFSPSYDKPVWHAYTSLVQTMTQADGGTLDVLRYCGGYRQISDLPTWAPDWTRQPSAAFSTSVYLTKPLTFSSLPLAHLPPASFSTDLRIMSVRGFVVGMVTDTSTTVATNAKIGSPPYDGAAKKGRVYGSITMPWASQNDTVASRATQYVWYLAALGFWTSKAAAGVYCLRVANWILELCIERKLLDHKGHVVVDALRKAKEVFEDLAAELQRRRHQELEIQKRRSKRQAVRRELGFDDTRSHGYISNKMWTRLPRAMANIFAGGTDDPEAAQRDPYTQRGVEWVSCLGQSWYEGEMFSTTCLDPRPGDVVVFLVGSRDAHLLRLDPGDELWTLVGVANIGPALRWLWRDAVRLYEEGKRELWDFDIK